MNQLNRNMFVQHKLEKKIYNLSLNCNCWRIYLKGLNLLSYWKYLLRRKILYIFKSQFFIAFQGVGWGGKHMKSNNHGPCWAKQKKFINQNVTSSNLRVYELRHISMNKSCDVVSNLHQFSANHFSLRSLYTRIVWLSYVREVFRRG